MAIISIIAALALPRMKSFMITARQTEAKTNLRSIFTLQQTFYSLNDRVGGLSASDRNDPQYSCLNPDPMNEIGFKISDCSKVRYAYYVTSSNAHLLGKFVAVAFSGELDRNKVIPGCARDEWYLNHNKRFGHAHSEQFSYSISGDCEYSIDEDFDIFGRLLTED